MLGLWNLIENLIYYLRPSSYLSPEIVKWLKDKKGYSDLWIKNNYLKDDAWSGMNRDSARKEYKEYVKNLKNGNLNTLEPKINESSKKIEFTKEELELLGYNEDLNNKDDILYCRYCGNKVLSGSIFCNKCGEKIN